MTNSEGGTDDEEFRCAAVVDRVNTTMQVWMGMTMGCAQCHDHKYDPISQAEYYQFYAILNNTQDADLGDEAPTLLTYTPHQHRARSFVLEAIASQETLVRQSGEPVFSMPTGPIRARFLRIELPGDRKFLSLAEVQVLAVDERGELANVALHGQAKQSSTSFAGPPRLAIDGNTNGDFHEAQSTTHTAQQDNPWWELDLGKIYDVRRIAIWNRTDNGVGHRLANFRLLLLDEDRNAVWVKQQASAPDPSEVFNVPKTFNEIPAAERKLLEAYLRDHTETPQRKRLRELRQELAGIQGVTTPILRELPPEKRRVTHIHTRGNFMVKGDAVTGGNAGRLSTATIARTRSSGDGPMACVSREPTHRSCGCQSLLGAAIRCWVGRYE